MFFPLSVITEEKTPHRAIPFYVTAATKNKLRQKSFLEKIYLCATFPCVCFYSKNGEGTREVAGWGSSRKALLPIPCVRMERKSSVVFAMSIHSMMMQTLFSLSISHKIDRNDTVLASNN